MERPAVCMLTGSDLVLNNGEITRPLTPMPRALLTMLALHPGVGVSRDWLADLLWPDTDQSTARQRLRMTLLNLRKALDHLPLLAIEANREAISLVIDPMDTDVQQFESAATSEHPDTRTIACDLYTGDLLTHFPPISGEFDQFLESRRAGLRSVAISLFHETLQSARLRGDMVSFESAYQRAIQIDPTNSAMAVLAMETLAERGFHERLDQEYLRFRTAYADAFDVPPPETTSKAYKSLIRGNGVNTMVATDRPVGPAQMLREPFRTTPSGSGHRYRRRLGALSTVLAIALLGSMYWLYQSAYVPAEGVVIVVRPYDVVEEGCTTDNIGRHYRQDMRDSLERMEGVSLVVSMIGRTFTRLGGETLELQQSVSCSGDLVRATLTLSRSGVAQVIWIGRFEATVDTLDVMAGRALNDLASEISDIQQ